MMPVMRIKAKITPWDDPEFVQAFEQARDAAVREGCTDCHKAGARVEHLLHEAGYPKATVEVALTVEEALDQLSHWVVTRDG